jgi:hypothetical protein
MSARALRAGLLLALVGALLGGCAHSDTATRYAQRDPYAADMGAAMARRAEVLGYSKRLDRVAAQRKARYARRAAARVVAQRSAPASRPSVVAVKAPAPVAVDGSPVTMSTHQPTLAAVEPPPLPVPAERVATPRVPAPKSAAGGLPAASGSKLMEDGRALLKAGKVVKARERFYAAMVGSERTRLVEVLPELARTYDPDVLAKVPNPDAAPNIAMARALYQRALMLGVTGVTEDVQRLGSGGDPTLRLTPRAATR